MVMNSLKVSGQITSPSADGSATTSYTNGSPNDDIFIFCGGGNNGALEVSVTAGSGPFVYQWFTYVAATHSWSLIVGQGNSTISNLASGGYRVEVFDNSGVMVVCDVAWLWNLNVSLNATANLSGCSDVDLNSNISTVQFAYYNPPSPQAMVDANTEITVCFSGNHSWVSDLGYYLIGPASCGSPVVTLANNNGSNCNQGNNFNNLCFTTENAPNFNVCNQNTPLSGTFDSAYGNPINWSPIYGCNASESGWSVMVFDCAEFDTGSLTHADIQFENLQTFCGTNNMIEYDSGPLNSPISDNSCNANSASDFTVPPSVALTTPINFSASLLGIWSTSGSAIIVDASASATDALAASSGDQFTYTLTVNAGTANCTFFDDVVFNNTAVPLSLSYPLTLCEGSGSIAPLLSGPSGGQYTSFPAGLTLFNNGNIQTNTSAPGTYVVTYTKTSGGCTQSTSVGLTIQDIPENLSMSPASICDGETFNGDAQTAFQYEYFLNGVSQSAPSSLSAVTSPVLSASDDWCVRGYEGPGIVIDGFLTESYWGGPLAAGNSSLTSSFGADNHLDALFVSQYQNMLSIGVAGQLQAGSNNRLLIFLDTETGGFNQLSSWTSRNDAPYYSLENLSGDIQFDAGFDPDYVLAVNTGSNGDSYVDLYHMASNTNTFLGSSTNPNFCSYVPAGSAFNVNAGYEFQFDLSELNNPQGSISLFAMLVNNPGSPGITTTLSNQFLLPADVGSLSYGDGLVNFNLALPNPVHYVIGSGNCYMENCLVINPSQNITLPSIPDQCLNSANPFVLNSTVNGVNGVWSPTSIDVSVSGSSLYSFTPNAAAGCYADGTTAVNVVDPAIPVFVINDEYCQGDTPQILSNTDGTITGTWSPSAILTNASATGTPLNYTFTPGANQCAADYTIAVTVNPTENPAFSFVTSLCQNATIPILPVSDDNGIQGSWSGAVNTAVLGNQSLTFTPTPDPAHACAVPSTVNFNITNGTPSTFVPIGPFCETENATLPSVSAEGFTGTWSPSIVDMTNFSAAGQSFTFQPDPNQCANSGTLNVVVLDAIDATFNFSTTYCQGSVPAALPGNSLNGYSGTWLPNVIATNTVGSSNYVFTPNVGSCANTTSVGMTINAPIAPVFNLPLTVCENATAPSLPVNSTNGVSGSWSPGTINTVLTGVQNFVFTHNPSSCATDYNYSIDVLPNQTPTFNGIGPFCVNATAPVLPANSNEGIAGSWNPAAINTSLIGSSSYIFTPSIGVCASNQTIQVVIDSQIAPTFSSIPTLCSTETAPVLATISNNGITGAWGPSSVDMTVIGVSTFTFTPNPNQCASNGSLDIDIIAPVNPLFSFTTNYCLSDLTDVLPNISDDLISGVWTPSFIDASNSSVNNHSFTVDAGQCANDVSIPVSINAPTDAVFAAFDLDFCLDEITPNLPISDDGGMSGTWSPMNVLTNASGSFVYTFTPNIGECGTPTDFAVVVNDPISSVISGLTAQYCLNDVPQNLPVENDDLIQGTWSPAVVSTSISGAQQYVFTPNPGNCYTDFSLMVDVFDLPTPLFSLSDPIISCNIPFVSITASGGVSYLWSDGSNANVLDVSNSDPMDVVVTDVNGCVNQATISVPMDTATTSQLNYSTDVLNCLTTVIDINVVGGQSYSWQHNGEVTSLIAVSEPGNYMVDILFDNGCSRILNVDIFQDTISPVGVIQNTSPSDILTCTMPNILLQASGGVAYDWVNGGITATQNVILPGLVECEVTGANFCLDTVSYEIFQDVVPPIVTITSSHPEFDCYTSNITLTASGNAIGYAWSNGLGTNTVINSNQSGLYSVTGTAANGCTTQESINLTVNRFYPDSNFTYSPFEIWDDNPTISLDGPDQTDIVYSWYMNGEMISDLNNVTFDLPSFTPENFEVCLNAFFTDICQSQECQIVSVKESLQVYIPTSFTPGYDGINDGYRPVFSNDNLIEKYQLEIFNRWGQKVFFTDDPNRGWDGNALGTGNYAPDGSYAVIITYRSVYDEDEKVHKGQVTFTR
jgi:gliding motility-associated-like protein